MGVRQLVALFERVMEIVRWVSMVEGWSAFSEVSRWQGLREG